MTQHTIKAVCPFADSDEGIPVEITFEWRKNGPMESEIDFLRVEFADPGTLLSTKLTALFKEWAENWLNEPGWDKANDIGWDAYYAEHGPPG